MLTTCEWIADRKVLNSLEEANKMDWFIERNKTKKTSLTQTGCLGTHVVREGSKADCSSSVGSAAPAELICKFAAQIIQTPWVAGAGGALMSKLRCTEWKCQNPGKWRRANALGSTNIGTFVGGKRRWFAECIYSSIKRAQQALNFICQKDFRHSYIWLLEGFLSSKFSFNNLSLVYAWCPFLLS